MTNPELVDHDGELNDNAVEKLTIEVTKALHLIGQSPDENTQLLYSELVNECQKYLVQIEESKETTKKWVNEERFTILLNIFLTEFLLTIAMVPPLAFIAYIEDPTIKSVSGLAIIFFLRQMLYYMRKSLIRLKVNNSFVNDYAEDLAYWDTPETALDLTSLLLPDWKIYSSNIDNKLFVNGIVSNAPPILRNKLDEEQDQSDNIDKKADSYEILEEKMAEIENEYRQKHLLLKTLGPKAAKAYLERKSE